MIQRRLDGSVDFYRGWEDYKRGFGDLRGEFWLGLEKIARLTNQTRQRLRVEMEDFTGYSCFAEYDLFIVNGENDGYRLASLGNYRGKQEIFSPKKKYRAKPARVQSSAKLLVSVGKTSAALEFAVGRLRL